MKNNNAIVSTVSQNPSRLLEAINVFLRNGDLHGIGNLMLEVLLRPNQHIQPDADAELLPHCVRQIIAHHYDVPESLTYRCALRDKSIPPADRGDWARDTFVQLIIMAYVFGASRTNLSPPHDKLLSFYVRAAEEQRHDIERAASEYKSRLANTEIRHSSALIVKIQSILRSTESDPELKLNAIEALVHSKADGPIQRVTVSPDDL